MRTFWYWLTAFTRAERLSNRWKRSESRVTALQSRVDKINREFEKRRTELTTLLTATKSAEERLDATIRESMLIQRRLEEELDSHRSQLRILEDTTVPTLMANIERYRAMWDAETAVQTRRQVGQLPREESL